MNGNVALGLTIVRVVAGLFMAAHGAMKLGNLSGFLDQHGSVMGLLAIAGELGGGLGLATGILARVAAGGVAAVMGYVAFAVQSGLIAKIGTGEGTRFEYPFLVAVVALAFVIMGPGPWTLPRLFGRR